MKEPKWVLEITSSDGEIHHEYILRGDLLDVTIRPGGTKDPWLHVSCKREGNTASIRLEKNPNVFSTLLCQSIEGHPDVDYVANNCLWICKGCGKSVFGKQERMPGWEEIEHMALCEFYPAK